MRALPAQRETCYPSLRNNAVASVSGIDGRGGSSVAGGPPAQLRCFGVTSCFGETAFAYGAFAGLGRSLPSSDFARFANYVETG